MHKQQMPIWLLVSGVTLIISGFLVKYQLATPPPDWNAMYGRDHALPFDPLGLSNKWFFLGVLVFIIGTVLFRIWGTRLSSVTSQPTATVKRTALVAGFWLALACAVELSATQWTYTARGLSSNDDVAALERNPHTLVIPKQGQFRTVYSIISKKRSMMGLAMIADNTTRDIASDLARDIRKEQGKMQQRKTFAALSWIAAIGFGFLFYLTQKQTAADALATTNDQQQ